MLDQCFKKNRSKAKNLIKRSSLLFKSHTCLKLAILTDHKKFISHNSVQDIMNETWDGPTKDAEISRMQYLIAYIFPPYICTFEIHKPTSHEQKRAEPKPSLPTSNGNSDIKTEETALVDK